MSHRAVGASSIAGWGWLWIWFLNRFMGIVGDAAAQHLDRSSANGSGVCRSGGPVVDVGCGEAHGVGD